MWKNEDGSEVRVIGSLKELVEHSTKKPKNTYYVMRHGEAKSNELGILETKGDPNNHLTEKGKQQVVDALALLKTFGIDLVVTSPFLRTQETAHIISAMLSVPVEVEEKIHEYGMGVFDGKPALEYFNHFGHDYLHYDNRPEGGETHREMMNRSMKAIMDLEEKYEGKKILIVTHGGPARMMIAGSELLTEEEVRNDEKEVITTLYLGNAEVRKLHLKIVPRDETGAINLHRPYIDEVTMRDSKGGEMRRIGDVFDCWFESGSMPFASIHYPFENKHLFDKNNPAQFIAEGIDQTRGWFYSLINLGVGLFDMAPYQHVIVNGHILAATGAKLSKSEKNYTDPMELVEKFGADAMRYALLSSPVVKGENLQFDDDYVSDVYKKCISRLENVVTLYEMNEEEDVISSPMSDDVLDRWMVSRIHELVEESTKGYDSYLLDDATHGIGYIIDDISVWYTRRSRERLKGDLGATEKKKAYETLKYTLLTLAKVMAPVMPFIAERVYAALGGERESVHLDAWPLGGVIDGQLIVDMKHVRDAVSLGLMKRVETKLNVKQPLLSVTFRQPIDEKFFNLICDELNVKRVLIDEKQLDDVVLDTTITKELQQEGDVRKLIRAVQDMRKEKGLQPSDEITLTISSHTNLGDLSLLISTCKVKEVKEDSSTEGAKVDLSDASVTVSLS